MFKNSQLVFLLVLRTCNLRLNIIFRWICLICIFMVAGPHPLMWRQFIDVCIHLNKSGLAVNLFSIVFDVNHPMALYTQNKLRMFTSQHHIPC